VKTSSTQRSLTPINFTVYGTPVPQGSKRAFYKAGMKHAVVIEDNSKTKPWRQELAGTAAEKMGNRPIELGPIIVQCMFFFDRPKSLKKSVSAKTTKPDVDKLARTVLDALTGTVFKDDGQVIELRVAKLFGDRPRAEISVTIVPY